MAGLAVDRDAAVELAAAANQRCARRSPRGECGLPSNRLAPITSDCGPMRQTHTEMALITSDRG